MITARSGFQKGFEKLAGFSLKKIIKKKNSMMTEVGYQIIIIIIFIDPKFSKCQFS